MIPRKKILEGYNYEEKVAKTEGEEFYTEFTRCKKRGESFIQNSLLAAKFGGMKKEGDFWDKIRLLLRYKITGEVSTEYSYEYIFDA